MSNKKTIILMFLLALISGFFWNQKMFGQPINSDQALYDSVAQNILSGQGFIYHGKDAGIEPLYPLFLAGVYKFFGHNYNAVRIVQIVLFALTTVSVYLLAEKIFNKKIAVWSGLIIALFYGLANQTGNIATETLFTFLLIASALAFYKAYFEDKNFWFAISAILLGFASLTRGIVQFLFIFAIASIFVVYFRKTSFKNAAVKASLFLVAFLLVLLPWTVGSRLINAAGAGAVAPRGGEILSVRAELMENLYPDYPAHLIGHLFGYFFSQKLYPNVSSATFRETPLTEKKIADLLKAGKNYHEIDAILTREAKAKILAAPHKYVLMSVLDFVSFNSPIIPRGSLWQNTLTIHPMFAEGRHSAIPEWAKAAIILSIRFAWFAFMFLVIYGLVKNFRGRSKIGGLFLVIIYFNLTYSAVHAIPRYALPVYPFYFILAAAGAFYFYNKYLKNRSREISLS